jgi:hypothetical protein
MRDGGRPFLAAMVAVMLAASGARAPAEVIRATPADYGAKAGALKPGDTLVLEAGEYKGLLRLVGLHGRPDAPITVTGPADPLEAVFIGREGANTLEFTDSSYLVVKRLTFDGQNIADDAIKANDSMRRPVHHITLEGNVIRNHGQHQTFVGINAQVPCWDWVIRGNTLVGAGTGMYFGDSEGGFPFVRALIEYNLVKDPKGYCLQIKHQNQRPDLEGLSKEPSETIIRYNVFAKNDAASEIGNRPNVLIDGLPDSGPGSRDRYHVYGNVFINNPREALFQGTGRISLHDNIFVSSKFPCVAIQPHSGKTPKSIRIYHNTIVTEQEPIRIVGADPNGEVIVVGNLIASNFVRERMRARLGSNMLLDLDAAHQLFASLSPWPDKLDLQPKERLGVTIPDAVLKVLAEDIDSGIDFARKAKTDWGYCGAFSQAFRKPQTILKLAGPDAAPDKPPPASSPAPAQAPRTAESAAVTSGTTGDTRRSSR